MLQQVTDAVRDIPFMTPAHGRRVFEHVRGTRPQQILELGTAHGVSAAYMAAAVAANGQGHVTSVDYSAAAFDPTPADVLTGLGLRERVTLVHDYSAYTWFLKERIEEQSDAAGNCEPLYDFCYLDGCKNWNIDGLAVFLVEKLLHPGGWLLMDDLEWRYADHPWHAPGGDGRPLGALAEPERNEPHLRAIFELIVRQHPSFTTFRIEDEWYGWARKELDAPRRYELSTSRPLSALIAGELRYLKRRRLARKRSESLRQNAD